jgi:hypothetical protein
VSVVRVLESFRCIILRSDFEDVRHWCLCFWLYWRCPLPPVVCFFVSLFLCFLVELKLKLETFIKNSLDPTEHSAAVQLLRTCSISNMV